ncbi:hypothetical protein [Vibrio hippocampi]|uniref:Lipoprotein n=1 Tax=Vibrio hippocampi TaxID=654686 RepID=A0ABM8ZGX6_9VIBR|nr:hypothetical protein [Vibrio hippocampi]CAH0525637.1 hypothetical protein VHP8226_01165 [Vibrio hippocampi]
MKKVYKLFGFFLMSSVSLSCFSSEWLEGVYINLEKDALIKDVVFCEDGKAYVGGMARGKYSISVEGDINLSVSSNGNFKLKVSSDRTELLPEDSFTKSWFTDTGFKLDSERSDTCNW